MKKSVVVGLWVIMPHLFGMQASKEALARLFRYPPVSTVSDTDAGDDDLQQSVKFMEFIRLHGFSLLAEDRRALLQRVLATSFDFALLHCAVETLCTDADEDLFYRHAFIHKALWLCAFKGFYSIEEPEACFGLLELLNITRPLSVDASKRLHTEIDIWKSELGHIFGRGANPIKPVGA